MSLGAAIGWIAAFVGVAFAARIAGPRAVLSGIAAAAAPCVVIAILSPSAAARLAGFPIAAGVLEAAVAARLLERRTDLVEAWLCAGARPLEVLARVRGRARPAILVAMAQILAALAGPGTPVDRAFVAALAGVGVASFTASVLATARAFVDCRLVDRPPAEAGSPFRLRPYQPPESVEVYESRPPE